MHNLLIYDRNYGKADLIEFLYFYKACELWAEHRVLRHTQVLHMMSITQNEHNAEKMQKGIKSAFPYNKSLLNSSLLLIDK